MSAHEWPPVSAVAGHFPNLPATTPPRPYQPKADAPHPVGVPVHWRKRSDYGTRVPVDGTKRCPQCWAIKAFPSRFDGRLNCNECRSGHSRREPTGPRS